MIDLRPLFAKHGLRCTEQREAIYRALASTTAHPTAEEIFHALRAKHAGVSLATIYNTLDAFERRGLCRMFTPSPAPSSAPAARDSAARYDADTSEHIHFVDEDGRIRDVPADLGSALLHHLPPDVLDQLERRLGVRIDHVSIQLAGRSTSPRGC